MRPWRFAVYALLLLVAIALAFVLSPRTRGSGELPGERSGGALQDTSSEAQAD